MSTLELAHWDSDPGLWQTLQINGGDVPGVTKIEATIGRKLEEKKGRGADGARIIDKGLELAKIKATVTFWTTDHWTSMEDLIDKLAARTALAHRNAVELFHPAIAALGLKKAVLKSMSSPKPSSVPGAYEIVFDFLEYNPPPASKKGTSSTRTPETTRGFDFGTGADIDFSGGLGIVTGSATINQNEGAFPARVTSGASLSGRTRESASAPNATRRGSL